MGSVIYRLFSREEYFHAVLAVVAMVAVCLIVLGVGE